MIKGRAHILERFPRQRADSAAHQTRWLAMLLCEEIRRAELYDQLAREATLAHDTEMAALLAPLTAEAQQDVASVRRLLRARGD